MATAEVQNGLEVNESPGNGNPGEGASGAIRKRSRTVSHTDCWSHSPVVAGSGGYEHREKDSSLYQSVSVVLGRRDIGRIDRLDGL